MFPFRSAVLGLLIAALVAAAPRVSIAKDEGDISGELGIFVGGNWADANLIGSGQGSDIAPLVGLRMASRFDPRWNWFADGVYAQHDTNLGGDLTIYEVRTGFELLRPMGSGGTNWFLAGAIGAAQANYPPGAGNFGRPLVSLGLGVAQSQGGWRGEIRVEDWLGDNGLGGESIVNGQILLGYAFGFRSPEGPGDSDGDGVTDDKDRCPNTPRGAIVDANGCPLDSDGDGVYDGIDKCPDTPRGTPVDKTGCPLEKALFEPGKEKLVLEGVNFAFNSDVLTADSYAVLDNVAASLEDWPDVRVRVEGYTDSVGDDRYNLGLSDRRANSVRNYLISKGIDGSRLEAEGYGEADPIASNGTEEGRAKNRRVELKQLR